MASTNQPEPPTPGTSDREIVISRVFDAPRELVFAVWTDPAHVGHWWGPDGFTLTTQVMDVRPGGHWRFVMHGPDGIDYANWIIFDEVERPERLVYTHGEPNEQGDLVADPYRFQVTVTFTDLGGRTEVTMRSVFLTAAARDHIVREYDAIEGARQTLGRLSEHLANIRGMAADGGR